MQERNIPTDKTQRVDEKNGVIYLVIIITPGVMVIKMSKMPHFLLMIAKNKSQFEKTILVPMKDLIWLF